MNPQWTDVVQAIASLGGLLVAVIGFTVLIYQARQVERAIRGTTHSGLYTQGFETMRLVVENPSLRPYFHADKELFREDPNYDQIMIVTEIVADFFEHVALQRRNLPKEVWGKWVNYIQSIYRSSPSLRAHFSQNRAWYSDEIICLFSECGTSASA